MVGLGRSGCLPTVCRANARRKRRENHSLLFPLTGRLQALLQTDRYRQLLQFESTRRCNPRYFTDVFDSPAWMDLWRGVDVRDRLGLVFCMDGYDGIGDDYIPAEFCDVSLPPYGKDTKRKTCFCIGIPMLCFQLILKRFSLGILHAYTQYTYTIHTASSVPSSHSGLQSKFFDYVVENELSLLHLNGVGGKVVRVLGISMDLCGREKFLRQQSCSSYFGCSVCEHRFEVGLQRKVTYTGARLWLPFCHPLRNEQSGEFDFTKLRASPELRTTVSVREACALVREESLVHFKGQYGAPCSIVLRSTVYLALIMQNKTSPTWLT